MMKHLARLVYLWHDKTIMSINETNKPKRGRPSVDSEAINLRLPRDVLDIVDDFRRGQSDLPTRPEAVRRLILLGIKSL